MDAEALWGTGSSSCTSCGDHAVAACGDGRKTYVRHELKLFTTRGHIRCQSEVGNVVRFKVLGLPMFRYEHELDTTDTGTQLCSVGEAPELAPAWDDQVVSEMPAPVPSIMEPTPENTPNAATPPTHSLEEAEILQPDRMAAPVPSSDANQTEINVAPDAPETLPGVPRLPKNVVPSRTETTTNSPSDVPAEITAPEPQTLEHLDAATPQTEKADTVPVIPRNTLPK
ncbi:MAG: hypothetical protein R3E01_23545 [Pirellulaceae bacterium]|nr:hypothetical protein [Planctomycetales bacterium]